MGLGWFGEIGGLNLGLPVYRGSGGTASAMGVGLAAAANVPPAEPRRCGGSNAHSNMNSSIAAGTVDLPMPLGGSFCRMESLDGHLRHAESPSGSG